MAGIKNTQCVGPSYHLADKKAAVQRAVNCYPQRIDGDTLMMSASPGETVLATLPGPIRNQREVYGEWFVVAGSGLYKLTEAGTYTLLASLVTESGFVGMANNFSQLVMVDGGSLYVYTLKTGVFKRINSEAWRGSDDVHELDGYMIFVDPETDQFYLSKIDDASVLDILDFSSADSSPDNVVTHRVSHRQLWLFGDLTTEIWINSGDQDFPFVRYQSYTLDIGVVGKRAVTEGADTLFWIGKSRRGTGIVYMAAGNQPQRVSTQAVEESLRAVGVDLSKASMWAYQVEGHEFIGIKAPGLETTWVYDAAMQQWHERGEWLDGWQPLRSGLVMAFGTKHYAGDDDGKITVLDADAHTLAGRPLVRERTWPHLASPSLEPINFRGVELSMLTGNGGMVSLELSNDGGSVFHPPLLRSLGATGRRMQRVRWNGLGASYNRVFRIRQSDPVPFAIYSATVNV